MLRSEENVGMKTTLDLPDALVSELKVCAVHEGREINDVIADMLMMGVSPGIKAQPGESRVVAKTLPLIKIRPAQPADAQADNAGMVRLDQGRGFAA